MLVSCRSQCVFILNAGGYRDPGRAVRLGKCDEGSAAKGVLREELSAAKTEDLAVGVGAWWASGWVP